MLECNSCGIAYSSKATLDELWDHIPLNEIVADKEENVTNCNWNLSHLSDFCLFPLHFSSVILMGFHADMDIMGSECINPFLFFVPGDEHQIILYFYGSCIMV